MSLTSDNSIVVTTIGSTIVLDSLHRDIALQNSQNFIFPEDVKAYIRRCVDEYLTLNLEDIIRSILYKIGSGEVTLRSDDAIERLALSEYRVSGGLSFSEINTEQTMPIVLSKIRNGEYSSEYIATHTINDMISSEAQELIANNQYIRVVNDVDSINKLKLMLSDLGKMLNDIINGKIIPASITTFDDLKLQADIKNSQGIISSLGLISNELYLAVGVLNDRITELAKNGLTNIQLSELLHGKTFDIILAECREAIRNGALQKITIDPIRAALLQKIEEIFNLLKSGVMFISNIPTFFSLLAQARALADSKLDLSEIMELLKALGLDVKNYDIMEYYRGLDKKLNQNANEEFFDFDVNNPPSTILKSIEEEYTDRSKFKFRYYKWVESLV